MNILFNTVSRHLNDPNLSTVIEAIITALEARWGRFQPLQNEN